MLCACPRRGLVAASAQASGALARLWSRHPALRRDEDCGFRNEASAYVGRLGAAVPEAELPLVSTMWARGGGLASVACLGPLAPTSCWCGWCRRPCCAVCVEALPGMVGIRALAECPGGMPRAHGAWSSESLHVHV